MAPIEESKLYCPLQYYPFRTTSPVELNLINMVNLFHYSKMQCLSYITSTCRQNKNIMYYTEIQQLQSNIQTQFDVCTQTALDDHLRNSQTRRAS